MPTSVALPAVRAVARVLALGVGALVLACAVATALFRSGADVPGSAALIGLALDGEFNVPTLVSVLLLAACAALLAAVGVVRRAQGGPYLRHWSALAVIFAAIAVDEGLRLHERLNEPMSTLPFTTGYLRWGWVVLGAALVVALAAVYLPFVRHLPSPQRLAAVAAAALFVGGALGLEMVGAAAAGTGAPTPPGTSPRRSRRRRWSSRAPRSSWSPSTRCSGCGRRSSPSATRPQRTRHLRPTIGCPS